MIRANFISTKGAWQATPADTIVLDHEGRARRRMPMTGTRGTEFVIDLPDSVALRGGDALILEDGRLIEIVAAPEPLAEARCNDPRQLARVAYHVGRHAQAEILANRIRIRRDSSLEDTVRGLGAKVAHIEAPFEPDTGAYEAPEETHAHKGHDHKSHDHKGHAHKHHGHDHHDHGHDHGHDHKHEHGHHAHAHDDACGCDDAAHKHEHAHEGHDHKHDHSHDKHDHDHKAHGPAHDHGHKHG